MINIGLRPTVGSFLGV